MHTEYGIDFIIFPSFSILQVRPNCIANYSTPLSILCFRLSGALAAPMKPVACGQLRLHGAFSSTSNGATRMSEMVGLDNLASFVKIASDHRRRIGQNMKSYVVKVSDCEEGPYDETQMAQMYADRRIDRNTPCKPVNGGEWKSVDDYLPMLK